VEEALAILQFTPRFSARIIEKTLRSAIANAVNRDDEVTTDADELFVSRIFADEGRTLKRLRPRARGSANRINKRQSHVTIIVSDGRAEVVRTDEASATEAVVDTAE
jgi:large subunit ribosomal protein L22